MRSFTGLDIDGRQGFCFGTDETWTALKARGAAYKFRGVVWWVLACLCWCCTLCHARVKDTNCATLAVQESAVQDGQALGVLSQRFRSQFFRRCFRGDARVDSHWRGCGEKFASSGLPSLGLCLAFLFLLFRSVGG